MARKLYSEKFRKDTVKQITDTSQRLGVHPDSLRNWII